MSNKAFKLRAIFISLFLLAMSSDIARALDPSKAINQYARDHWQTDQGLPQNSVVAIVQTRDGYLWLATQEGLVRFDGINFTVFDKRNTSQILQNTITALYEDREGRLWIGTEGGGLTNLKDGVFTAYTTKDGLADDIVDSIYQDRAGNIWIGTLGGLNLFKDEKFVTYTTKDGLSADTVLATLEDREGNIWIGTDGGGLCRMSNGKFTAFTTADGLPDDVIRTLHEDQHGNLWIATRLGLCYLREGKFTTYTTKDGLTNNSIWTVYEDREGNFWIGTDGGGLNRFRDGAFESFTTKDGLSDDSVAAIYEDREGNLWAGTYGGGLNRFKSGKFKVYTTANGLADDMARAILEDRQGNVWIATRNGMSRFRNEQFNSYFVKDGLADNSVLSLHEDRAGTIWIGTRSGLNQLKDGKFKLFSTKDGLSDDTVLSICEGADGSIWAGTSSGLNRLKDGQITSYTTENGLTNNSVWSLLADKDGSIWIGTDGGGLNKFKDGAFSSYTTSDGLVNNIVLSLYRDAEDTIWIGTDGGLNRLKAGLFTSYTVANGLFEHVVFAIVEDSRENLWISCNKGIYRVSKHELDDIALRHVASITSVSYGTADGMKSRECNGGFQPAGWRMRNGELWFPTVRGIVVIAPENIAINEEPPPVKIERFIVDGKVADARDGIQLDPGKGKFEFHYTGLSYLAPEKVRFKYRLEGYENEWTDAGTRRDATYNNIPPGRYVFRVIASNNDGIWNETGATLEFYLKPHFYQTYWFYGLCAAIAALIAWLIYRLRVRQMESEFSAVLGERNRMAREIHDTLAQGFAGISVQLESVDEMLDESPDVAREHLDRARMLVRSSLAEARRSVWALRSQRLEESDLATAIARAAHDLFPAATVRFLGSVNRLSGFAESNLLRIAQEALTNAIKHAGAGSIEVELEFTQSTVRLTVKDDGCGFDPESVSHSNGNRLGLISMRERAEHLGGQLILISTPGCGTEVTVIVPVKETR